MNNFQQKYLQINPLYSKVTWVRRSFLFLENNSILSLQRFSNSSLYYTLIIIANGEMITKPFWKLQKTPNKVIFHGNTLCENTSVRQFTRIVALHKKEEHPPRIQLQRHFHFRRSQSHGQNAHLCNAKKVQKTNKPRLTNCIGWKICFVILGSVIYWK